MSPLAVIPPAEMTLATGQARPVVRVWPDGSFNCPWCAAACPPGTEHCPNPACWANEQATAERIVAEQEQQAARREAAAAEATRREALRVKQEAQRAAERQAWAAVAAEAAARDACLTCLVRSPWRSGAPRYVRHQRADFHAA